MNDSSFLGKNILLLYARFFGYDQKVKETLESLGAHVDLFDARANINAFEKALKKITRCFYVKKQRRFHRLIANKMKGTRIDYIFSNEYLDSFVLDFYKKQFPMAKFVLYMDDSVANFHGIESTFSQYDRILTFDRLDSKQYGLIFRPLFYCDCFNCFENTKTEYDVSFVGTCHSDRVVILDAFKKKYSFLKTFFYCYMPSKFVFRYYKLKDKAFKNKSKKDFQYKSLSLENTAQVMKASKAILDIHHPKQSGLTMRSIEAFGCHKKLITTNKDIINYDFYNPDDICIIDRNNPAVDELFFKKDVSKSNKDLHHKYSLIGWIEDVFLF